MVYFLGFCLIWFDVDYFVDVDYCWCCSRKYGFICGYSDCVSRFGIGLSCRSVFGLFCFYF